MVSRSDERIDFEQRARAYPAIIALDRITADPSQWGARN
jgi:hypothetical protein